MDGEGQVVGILFMNLLKKPLQQFSVRATEMQARGTK